MTRTRRPSAQTTAVVLALAEHPASWRYGYELCQQLDLKAGSVYPILMRLADRGLLETAWERDVPAGRPPRHLYRLTGPGRVLAAELATEPPMPAKGARPAGRVGRQPRLEGTWTAPGAWGGPGAGRLGGRRRPLRLPLGAPGQQRW